MKPQTGLKEKTCFSYSYALALHLNAALKLSGLKKKTEIESVLVSGYQQPTCVQVTSFLELAERELFSYFQQL